MGKPKNSPKEKKKKKQKENVEPSTPKATKPPKISKNPESPGKSSQCSSSKKKGGLFKRIGGFMLPATALAPASPVAEIERIGMSQSCADLPPASPPLSPERGLRSTSVSSPNLFSSTPPPPHLPPPGTSTTRAQALDALLGDDQSSVGGSPTILRVESLDSLVGEPAQPDLVVEEIVTTVQSGPVILPPSGSLRSDSACSVEYSVPDKRPPSVPPLNLSFRETSPPRSAMKSPSHKDRRISFAGDEEWEVDGEGRVVTPDILKKDLAMELGISTPLPDTSYFSVNHIPDPDAHEHLPLWERCEAQAQLLHTYESEIHNIRDKVLDIVSENTRLQTLVSEKGVYDVDSLQKQAQDVLRENRTLIKEQQMNQARWQELIEERNSEVLRIRAICTNMEDQNTTLIKRCNKLDDKNEELREAYNTIVLSATQADDFVPVRAHLSSIEGYKVALEDLRKRYDGNIFDKNEEIEGLEQSLAELTEKLEVLEEDKSLMGGQCKGLKESLERAQHSSARHKREAIQLTQRVNTLKTSLVQAISIAEQSTLQKLELAEILQISDLQEKQKRSYMKSNTTSRIKEVKKVANAKLKSCAEILQERENEHELSISHLQDKISKLKMRCKEKGDQIQILSHSDKTLSN